MTPLDRQMMARALRLARKGLATVSPNPAVGCVIARDAEILGEGWHQRAGGPHAEVNALQAAEGKAKGATAYVTLEPCCHQGKTPPCADALIRSGVSRVVYAMQDPNPAVAGQGLARLQEAGIEIAGPLLEEQAVELNCGFVKRHTQGMPWVVVKLAMSLDGRTAMASGESQWITGAAARRDVQRYRSVSCAVISGINTVLQDDARLTVRPGADDVVYDQSWVRQPLRVILDSQARLPAQAALLQESGEILQVVSEPAAPVLEGVERLLMPAQEGIALPELLKVLAERQCNRVLVEAGATLAGSFIQSGLVDELVVYQAPTILGSGARPLLELPLEAMAQQKRFDIKDVRSVGGDIRIIYTPVK